MVAFVHFPKPLAVKRSSGKAGFKSIFLWIGKFREYGRFCEPPEMIALLRRLAGLLRTQCALLILFVAFVLGAGCGAAEAGPLKVFILAGQSNMQGHAKIETFEHIGMDPETAPLLKEMQDEKGNPRVCEQVWISYLSTNREKQGPLTAGFGADDGKIGPEFTFGITMEKQLQEPILLIKTAWGGKSMNTDFRSPSAGPYEFNEKQLETFAKQGKDVDAIRAEKAEATGHYYRLMIDHVKKVLGEIDAVYPDYNERDGYELAGFAWFQGWNDMVDSGTYPARDQPGGYDAYSTVLAHLVRDVRKEFSAPAMPFVIGVLGVNGPVADYGPDEQRYAGVHQNFRDAMAAPARLPEFEGNVTAVLTENYWDPELKALTKRDEKVKGEAKKIQKEKGLKGVEAQAVLEELRAAAFSESEREILSKGISNQAYHYLGSGKIMAQIGRGFAEALVGISSNSSQASAATTAPAAASGRGGGRNWTQDTTGRQLQGELVKAEGEGQSETITIRSGGRLVPIPLSMLTAEDQEFVAAWKGKQAAVAPAPTIARVPDHIPDFTKGAEIPQGAAHDWNLGPTGARGWIYSDKKETSEARQIFITEVEEDSPADGQLETGDVILGIADRPFAYDPRTELGKAIVRAEASDGQLSLMRWREGEIVTVTLPLGVLGSYSVTAPFDCPKSTRILEQGCEALARHMKENPNEGNHITGCYNALALLASGDPDYLRLVREQVERVSDYSDPERRTLHAWFYGPITILVAEYTLATGDDRFMSDLERLAMEIVRGQSVVGSWGHRFVQESGILSGYGMMNAPGLPLTLSLVLARAAGVSDPALDEAIDKSTRLLRFYVGKGSIPYGDHRPWTQTHDDNGKNGAAAVLFNLLGDAEAAEYFSRMGTASHGAEREMGHTGNFFNLLWAMPSVALSGPQASGAWMREYGWYYDLARRWDGTYRHQGPAQERNDSYHNWNSTGPYLLAYALPLRKIFLTGKKQGVVPQVDETTAAGLIADGRDWSPRFKDEPYADRDEGALLGGLKSWSPIVRERAAMALGNRDGNPTRDLVAMLGDEEDLHTRIGACQALAMLKNRAAPAVRELRKTLKADDLWLRIEAAEALAAIGAEAMPAVPDLLEMLADYDADRDPRAMQQRYLCFALFDRRSGMLRGSLEGVDREALYRAVRGGLANEDGRARGALGTVYKNLDYDEIEPLLPAIVEAVAAPAPSGIMFADGIRIAGLELLAQYHHEEGLDYFIDVMGVDRWGQGDRVLKCLKILQQYGGAAKTLLPQLAEIEKEYLAKDKTPREQLKLLRETMAMIEADRNPPELRSVGGGR